MTAMSAVLYSVGVDSSLIYRLLMETDSGNCKFDKVPVFVNYHRWIGTSKNGTAITMIKILKD